MGESIRRFSRHKLVLDGSTEQEEELPLHVGDVTKEELVERWLYTVRTERLDVREGMRALSVEPMNHRGTLGVRVSGDGGEEVLDARAVLIAIGRRGTPRKLGAPVADAALGRVHYELSDARSFAGKTVVVVGLGDVAMETALAIAAQPGSRVSVVHRGDGFRRGRRRNVEALGRLVAKGRVDLYLRSEVVCVRARSLSLDGGGVLAFDALFVHIGTLPEHRLLETAGVCVAS
jgi:thioredoxin reductase